MHDSVAQLVEQLTLNQRVEGSSPSGVTLSERDYSTTLYALDVILFFVPRGGIKIRNSSDNLVKIRMIHSDVFGVFGNKNLCTLHGHESADGE